VIDVENTSVLIPRSLGRDSITLCDNQKKHRRSPEIQDEDENVKLYKRVRIREEKSRRLCQPASSINSQLNVMSTHATLDQEYQHLLRERVSIDAKLASFFSSRDTTASRSRHGGHQYPRLDVPRSYPHGRQHVSRTVSSV
jgi:hypothetical protein